MSEQRKPKKRSPLKQKVRKFKADYIESTKSAAATDRLASNYHYSYSRFNTQYMLFLANRSGTR